MARDDDLCIEGDSRVDSEFGSVELRDKYMLVTPAAGRIVGLEEGHRLTSIKLRRYGDAPVYIVYHNINGVEADYAFMSRADHFCGDNSIPLILVVDPSPRARVNIAIAHLLAKASCFKTVASLEEAFEYIEAHPL